MRLINVDELPVVNSIERIEGRDVFVESWIPATTIWNAPTVEAIPIVWIDTYCTDCSIDLRDNDATAIKKLLGDWRKENEGIK